MLDRLESFPFDSAYVGYDDYGYPVFDRAVGANMYRDVLGKFFTDGVFQTSPNSLYISKGEGLNITISPGLAIIKGGIGGFRSEKRYALDQANGKYAYSVFIRLDDNEESRSLFIRIEKSAASDNPVPPEPISTAAIKEYRLGYIIVPSNATDLSGATIVNEQGLATCPYAAPFAEIDVSQVIKDVKDASQAQYDLFVQYIEDNKALIDSMVDGSMLETITAQIDACVKKDTLDPRNLSYDAYGKLGLASGAVDNDTLEFNNNRAIKISTAFVNTIDQKINNVKSYVNEVVTPGPGDSLDSYKWSEIVLLADQAKSNPSAFAYMLGMTKPVSFSGYGTVDMQLIGIAHDDLASGSGKAGFTFMSKQALVNQRMNASNVTSGGWAGSEMKNFMANTLLPTLPTAVRNNIKQVKKKYCSSTNFNSVSTSNDKLFLASEIEVFGTTTYGAEGSQYQYWSENNSNNARIKYPLNSTSGTSWWLRSIGNASAFCAVSYSGSLSGLGASNAASCVPCFCI